MLSSEVFYYDSSGWLVFKRNMLSFLFCIWETLQSLWNTDHRHQHSFYVEVKPSTADACLRGKMFRWSHRAYISKQSRENQSSVLSLAGSWNTIDTTWHMNASKRPEATYDEEQRSQLQIKGKAQALPDLFVQQPAARPEERLVVVEVVSSGRWRNNERSCYPTTEDATISTSTRIQVYVSMREFLHMSICNTGLSLISGAGLKRMLRLLIVSTQPSRTAYAQCVSKRFIWTSSWILCIINASPDTST